MATQFNAPLPPEEIEKQQARERAEAIRHTYGYVNATGNVSQHVVLPPKNGEKMGLEKGDCPLLWMNGRVEVVERHRRMGGRLLEEICISDLGKEQGEAKYALWKQAISYRGKVAIKNVLELYPPTVLRLRAESASGVALDMVFDAAQGGLVKATEEAMASRVAGLLDGAGVGRPTETDRKSAKEAKAS